MMAAKPVKLCVTCGKKAYPKRKYCSLDCVPDESKQKEKGPQLLCNLPTPKVKEELKETKIKNQMKAHAQYVKRGLNG